MAHRPADNHSTLIAHLPGWLFLLAGMTLASAALLMPAWLQAQQMAWQLQVMRLQAEQLESQAAGYQQFNAALASNDPVLLERLAYHYLRLRPAGAVLIGEGLTNRPDGSAAVCVIQASLHQPVPRVGVDVAARPPNRSRLARLTSGRSRLALLAAGVLCLAAGVTAPSIIASRRSI